MLTLSAIQARYAGGARAVHGQVPAGRLMLNSEHNLQAFMLRTYRALMT
jgi:hypothetical protein